jgi:tetratricopeptide (TPR) repeat protein
MHDPYVDLCVEAETLQNRAERHQRLDVYDQAGSKFEEALLISTAESSRDFICDGNDVPWERIQDCRCLLGEVLQNKAELLLTLWSEQSHGGSLVHCLVGDHTLEDERKVFLDAHGLFLAAAGQYRATVIDSGSYEAMRVDCLVNLGNTLANHGNLYCQILKENLSDDIEQCRQLYMDSLACYQAALEKERDAATWNNCADMLISHAEFEADSGARHIYEKAIDAYGKACELSSTENGDNLPSLLCDWGSGLLSFSEYVRKKEKNQSLSLDILSQAEKRLQDAVSFDRGSTAPHTALGDVYIDVSDIYFQQGRLEDAWKFTEMAMNDGYGMALKIYRSHTDALVGSAETYVQRAKIAGARGIERAPLFKQAVTLYQEAFVTGKFSGTLREKGDALYNVACCLVGIGNEVPQSCAFEEASDILRQLVDKNLLSIKDIISDEELTPLHETFRKE